MHSSRRTIITSLVLFFLSQIFFLVNIQFPRTVNFDEFHYVPAAKQFLMLQPNRNWEHPPLGKILIAVGIGIFGDRPIGWRFMSTTFGSLTLVGVYFLSLILFSNPQTALWISLLTLFNQLLYVQSRIGMLDTFMFAFVIWGLVAFCASWNSRNTASTNQKLFLFTGLMMGLGTACKWFALIPWAAILLLVLATRTLQVWETTFAHQKQDDWYRPDLWSNVTNKDLLLALGVIPTFAYFATFLPYLLVPGAIHSWADFFQMQIKMWEGQLRVVSGHPYMSQWTDWAILRRPIWYAFDKEGPNQTLVRGVLLIGNPWIMWTGLVALLFCAYDWFYQRRWNAFLIVYFYLVFYGCWTMIPRKISFYYYYYPAGMLLSLAIGYFFENARGWKWAKSPWAKWGYLSTAFLVFLYFFPILAALKIPINSFRQWMWFASWI